MSQRARRQPHGRWLRARNRQARRLHDHCRPWRDQRGDRHRPGLLRFAAHARAIRSVCHTHAGEGLGSDPRTRRPGCGNIRIHRVQRHDPISGRAARIGCPCLCGVSRQPASSGPSVAASGRPPGTRRGRLEAAPRPVLADARSGGGRRGRGAPRAGKVSSDSRRRRRGRHAQCADCDRRVYRGSGSFHQRRQGDSSGIPPFVPGLLDPAEIEPAGSSRRRRGAAGWLASRPRRPLPAKARYFGRHHSDRHRSHGIDIDVFRGGAHCWLCAPASPAGSRRRIGREARCGSGISSQATSRI